MSVSTNAVSAPISTIGSKPDTSKVNQITMVRGFTLLGGKKSPFKQLTSNRAHFSAWLMASSLVCDYITISNKGLPVKAQKKSQHGLFRLLIGSTAWNYWNSKEYMEHEAAYTDEDGKKYKAVAGITKEGLNVMQARLSGNGKGYNTTLETVRAFEAAIRKGGKVKIDDVTYNFDSEIAAKRA